MNLLEAYTILTSDNQTKKEASMSFWKLSKTPYYGEDETYYSKQLSVEDFHLAFDQYLAYDLLQNLFKDDGLMDIDGSTFSTYIKPVSTSLTAKKNLGIVFDSTDYANMALVSFYWMQYNENAKIWMTHAEAEQGQEESTKTKVKLDADRAAEEAKRKEEKEKARQEEERKKQEAKVQTKQLEETLTNIYETEIKPKYAKEIAELNEELNKLKAESNEKLIEYSTIEKAIVKILDIPAFLYKSPDSFNRSKPEIQLHDPLIFKDRYYHYDTKKEKTEESFIKEFKDHTNDICTSHIDRLKRDIKKYTDEIVPKAKAEKELKNYEVNKISTNILSRSTILNVLNNIINNVNLGKPADKADIDYILAYIQKFRDGVNYVLEYDYAHPEREDGNIGATWAYETWNQVRTLGPLFGSFNWTVSWKHIKTDPYGTNAKVVTETIGFNPDMDSNDDLADAMYELFQDVNLSTATFTINY